MTAAVLACQAIAAVVCVYAIWTVREALRDLAGVFDRVEHRAHMERHTLAGRVQRPDLLPSAPPPIDQEPGSDPGDAGLTDLAAFEAAGRDLDGMTDQQLAAVFGDDMARELKRG